jgi:hypothetical protein
MPCSPRDEHLALLTTISPASPNNDPLSKKIICQLDIPSLGTREDVRELLVKAVYKPAQSSEETLIEGDPLKPRLSDMTATEC